MTFRLYCPHSTSSRRVRSRGWKRNPSHSS